MRLALLALLLLLLSATAFALPPEQEAAARLRQLFPRLPVAQIRPAAVPGLFEVVDAQDNILYFSPASGHLLFGELVNADGRNLTLERYEELMTARFDRIPLEKGLKIGSGPNVVVEVTDPDCPYCRNGAAFFAQRQDVTRYIFFTPLTKIHPEAEKKARYILSAPRPAEAYQDVMDGLYDGKPLPEFKDNGRLDEQIAVGKALGTKGTPNYWVNGRFVSGSNHERLERYLKK